MCQNFHFDRKTKTFEGLPFRETASMTAGSNFFPVVSFALIRPTKNCQTFFPKKFFFDAVLAGLKNE
jgi:hypothetical protein